jgi:hypothetical protein
MPGGNAHFKIRPYVYLLLKPGKRIRDKNVVFKAKLINASGGKKK